MVRRHCNCIKKTVKDGKFDQELLQKLRLKNFLNLKSTDKEVNEALKQLKDSYENQLRILTGLKEERINKLKKGDVLPSGVIKMVKVYIAMKRTYLCW